MSVQAALAPEPRPDFYKLGGALDARAESYVARAADAQLLEAVAASQYCYVLTPRQMGKSSLMVRTAAQLRRQDVRSVIIDLTNIGSSDITPEQWYLGHLKRIHDELKPRINYLTWWREQDHLGPVQRFTAYFQDVLLRQVPRPIAIFIDEIDTTLALSFSDDYFAAIRSLYNQRASSRELQRLTFVLLGVASPSDLIKDTSRTPFNVGTRISLTDFSGEEAAPLVRALAPDARLAVELLKHVMFWTCGHPYLTQTACRKVAEWAQSEHWNPKDVPLIVDDLVKSTFFADAVRNSDSNLGFVRDRILSYTDRNKILNLYRQIRVGETVVDDELDPVRVTLKLSGVVKVTDSGLLTVRNRIYERVFDTVWVETAMGEAQQPASAFTKKITGVFENIFGARPEPEAERRFKYDVFVSYSHRDGDFVRSFLVPSLRDSGLGVFVDFAELRTGEQWSKSLENGLTESRDIVAVMSPDYFASRFGSEEAIRAVRLQSEDKSRRLIPLLLKPTDIPPLLATLVYADFTRPESWDQQMARLLATLGGRKRVAGSKSPRPSKRTSAVQYDTGAIRELLDDAFDDFEIADFAFDYFRPAYDAIGPDRDATPKRFKIQKLIEEAEQQQKFDELLDQIARLKPRSYRRFADRLEKR